MSDTVAAERQLEQLGYKQELKRNYSLLSLIAFGIVTLTPPSAIANTLQAPIATGGPQALVWGYILVSVFTIVVALSMAEISAVYPVAGGPCSWAYQLASKKYRVLASYFTGYFNIFAQISFAASASFQGTVMILGMTTLQHPGYVPQSYQYVLVSMGFIILFTFTNVFFNSWQSKSVIWLFVYNIVTVIITMIVLLATVDVRQDAKFIFTNYVNLTGFSSHGYVFILGLLQSAYTFTGYDSVTHLAEEMRDPSRGVPRALMTVIVTSVLYGFAFVIVVVTCLSDIPGLLESSTGAPFIQLVLNCTNNVPATIVISLFPTLAALVAANTMTLVNSRTIYSFARDGAFVFPKTFAKINDKHHVPIPAIIFSCVIQCIIVILYLSSNVVFNTIISMATIGHDITYAIPIACCLLGGRRHLPAERPWNLGKYGIYCNIVALVFLIFISITMLFPTMAPVTAGNMNYTVVIVAIVIVYAVILWFAQAKRTFRGPSEVIDGEVTEISDISEKTDKKIE